MKLFTTVFFLVIAFVYSGCDTPSQQQTSSGNVELVDQTDSPKTDFGEGETPSEPNNAVLEARSEPRPLDFEMPSSSPPEEASSSEPAEIVFGDRFPEVLAVEAKPIGDTNWRFNVTLSSTYDSPQRYADAWRVLDGEGNELGIRILGHDHASEQPFTRSGKIEIPAEITTVFVEGRDQANGWSGQRFKLDLPVAP